MKKKEDILRKIYRERGPKILTKTQLRLLLLTLPLICLATLIIAPFYYLGNLLSSFLSEVLERAENTQSLLQVDSS